MSTLNRLLIRLGLLVALVALTACSQQIALFNNMSERDANEVLAALDRVDIVASKAPGKDGAINLMVPQGDVARAVAHLDSEGLPRQRRATMGDVFRKEGLISSPLEERARYLWALSQELSETLGQIDGVLTARVHVVLPERSTGGDPGLPSSAAVFIKHRRDVDLQPNLPELKRLVASSIPGLTTEKVNVVLVVAAPPHPDDGEARPAAPAASADREAELRLREADALRQRHQWIWGGVTAIALLMLVVLGWLARRWLKAPREAAPASALSAVVSPIAPATTPPAGVGAGT